MTTVRHEWADKLRVANHENGCSSGRSSQAAAWRSSAVGGGCGHIESEGSLVPDQVRCVEILGSGRAAEARLVEVKTREGDTFSCVEKVFAPGILTRIIYRCCFQTSFAYQDNRDAILAAFYRRRLAWALCRAFVPEANVARPLYVRWDRESKAMVLASELIRGRGIIPAPIDKRMVRRALGNWMSRGQRPETPPSEEIEELLSVMQRLERLFLESGMVGTGWQVSRRAIVSTANLLRTSQGYVSIDLESGIPAMLVSTYVAEGLRLRSMPLFDDLDPEKMGGWIQKNRKRLAERLQPEQLEQMERDAHQLMKHTQRWKESEPAIFRRPTRLFTDRFRIMYRQRVTEQWSRRGIWDQHFEAAFRARNQPLLASVMFWLGCLPGSVGRFLQGCWSNGRSRTAVKRFIFERPFRDRVWRVTTGRSLRKWQAAGRLPADREKSGGMSLLQFFAHRLLAATAAVKVHRLMADPHFRRNWLIRIVLLCISPRFQSDYGSLIIRKRVHAWRKAERLTEAEEGILLRQLDHPAIEEYLRGFGMHVGLKLLFPVVLSLKAVGAAASLASGDPIYFLVMLMVLPMLRTAVTLWRKIATGRPWSDFREALIVGALPSVGSLAFPVQMYATCSELSAFLLRDFAAQLGRWLPIYGGKDSRTEMACIKAVNVVAELMELWLLMLGRAVHAEDSTTDGFPKVGNQTGGDSGSRWDRLAHSQLEMVRAELVSAGECSSQVPRLAQSTPVTSRHAA